MEDTETSTVTDRGRTSLVAGAHRLIRVVDTAEGPFAGALVSHGESVAVSVDVDELAGWPGWAFSASEHVCGALDVRRRIEGHDALLPWCVQRVEVFLGRRRAAGAVLSAGEIGTLTVSLLRGMRELGEEAERMDGDWWLTGDGRPLFVHAQGGSARSATAALVDRISEHTSDRALSRVLTDAAAALRQSRHHALEDERWEEQLFEIAAPRALRLDVFAPERAVGLGAPRSVAAAEHGRVGELRRDRVRASRGRPGATAPRASLLERLGGMLAGVRARLMVLLDERRERWAVVRRSAASTDEGPARGARSRRKPLLIAGVAAIAVLTIGLMWPTGSGAGEADAVTPRRPAAPSAAVDVDPAGAATPEQETVQDAATAAVELVGVLGACAVAGDSDCADAMSAGAPAPASGLAVAGVEASTAELVDDYGDVAVVRLTPGEAHAAEAAQMLVLERREDEWLVRDVYDVAHQPE